MQINVYATLRPIVGQKTITLDLPPDATLGQLVDAAIARWPALAPELLDQDGALLGAVHVFLNGRDGHYLEQGLQTRLAPTDMVDIFPAVGGG